MKYNLTFLLVTRATLSAHQNLTDTFITYYLLLNIYTIYL